VPERPSRKIQGLICVESPFKWVFLPSFFVVPKTLFKAAMVSRVAALGPQAKELVSGHEFVPGGLGKATPFDYMARHQAQIVGIGKTFQVMTQTHHVENLLGETWPVPHIVLPNVPVTIVDNQCEIEMEIGGMQQLWTFNIWKLKQILNEKQLKEWRFHNCPMFAARANEVTDALVD